MKAIDRPFTAIIHGTKQFLVPVFQRDYGWTEAQCEQLWTDVMRAAAVRDGGHFLGSVVSAPSGDTAAGFTRWMMIDGQQRMATLILLLTALRDHIAETNWVGGEDDPTVAQIDAYFLKNQQELGSRQRKLVLRRFDEATLNALVDRQHLPDNLSERIRDNYEYFREQLANADPGEVYRGIGRLVVVDVTLDPRYDDPQLVFESLNSTGLDLSQADLIRNFILMRLREEDQTRLYNEYWSRLEVLFRESERAFDAFARDFMALRTRATKQEKGDRIYTAFRSFYPDLREDLGGTEPALSELLRNARYYAAFVTGSGGSKSLQTGLARVRRLVDVPAMLIMRLYDCHDRAGSLSESDFLAALQLVESYVFRRAICGLQTRNYWQIFANMAYRVSDEHPLDDLKVALATQHDSYRYPDDDEFYSALEKRDLYGLRVSRFLLETLENHGSQEPTDTSSYSIEHVMPQNRALPGSWREMLGPEWERIHQTWLHRLGNLTLTGYNSTYSDRPFEQKKTIEGGFEDSAVRLNRFIRDQPVWTEEVIEQRTIALARKSLSIWKSLEVDPQLIHAARERELRELASGRDTSEVKMSNKARELFIRLSEAVRSLDSNVLEVASKRTVSYYQGPSFFLEVLPRKHHLTLLLPLDFHEVDDPHGMAEDATQWKFFYYAQHEGGVALSIHREEHIANAVAIVQQARSAAGA